ncbi:DUF1775 domain-containing protein [Streptomyces hainanensis]|uniref:DUF1775 domain-containing protein n=1 Tax=Streptomyces hainanensis TaxID=402648 RepID=A0A4R4SER7_9ACTN|nr:DUF1775 domain-containing protein [Streptomyces hainanensis]TDC61838.1 DUF1775 domain-containing protein [Streptomyces hainanensis]
MSRTNPSRALRRAAVAASAAVAAVLLTATPSLAHVEVEADTPQALAENVTLSFLAESESASEGITELRVVLPEGIAPRDVTYVEGPEGWEFTATDDGYTVAGPAVAAGEGAEYAVAVRQLPDAEELVFKTLQTYEDGRIDRWIELDAADSGGHGNEAPRLALEPAAPGATPVEPVDEAPADEDSAAAAPEAETTPETEPAESEESPAESETAAEDDESGGLSTGVWIAVGVALLGGVAVYLVRRRSAS